MRKIQKTDKYITQLTKQDLIDLVYSFVPEENENTSEVNFRYVEDTNELDVNLIRKPADNSGRNRLLIRLTFGGDYQFCGLDYDVSRYCPSSRKMPISSDEFQRGILKFMIKTLGKEYAYEYLANRAKLIEVSCKKAQKSFKDFYSIINRTLQNTVDEKNTNADVQMEVDKELAIESLKNLVDAIIAEIELEDGVG